ncbi:MAG TPA: site-specific integrase [Phyllobacterium sp.]|nr:site-specific integrase [Phyllobacterium sp.]
MSNRSKGPHIWFRPESRKADGSIRNKGGYVILDAGRQISIGSGVTDIEDAERCLTEYLGKKHQPKKPKKERDPSEVLIADVVNLYSKDVVPNHKRQKATAARLELVLAYFGEKTVDTITNQVCREYAAQNENTTYLRHQLEDLRAALNHYKAENLITWVPSIPLPPKGKARTRYLKRQEAARLIWAAWRMTQTWKGKESKRRTGQHLARFLLVSLYTGTRSGAVCGAAIRPTVGRGYVDLDDGVFHRRADDAEETNKRQPSIRLPDRLLPHLRRWRDCAADPIKDPHGPRIADKYVVEWNGKPVLRVKKSFRAACDKAGLGADVIPHTLRHTAATWMMQAGVDMWEASGYLGMSVEVLRDVYGHHHPDHQQSAANAISRKRPAAKTTAKPADNVINLAAARKVS